MHWWDVPFPQMEDIPGGDTMTTLFLIGQGLTEIGDIDGGGRKVDNEFGKIVSASNRSSAATTRRWLPVPQPIDSSWSPDSVTFNFLMIKQELTKIGDIDKGGGKMGMDLYKLFLLSKVLAPPQRVDDCQYHNQSIRLNLQIVLRSIFLNI